MNQKIAKIKIGQIGTAHAHAAGKMAAFRNSDEYEVVGVVDPDLGKNGPIPAVYQDVPRMTREQLLNVSGLQAVAVETAVRDLLDVALECVHLGMHIHLDKPAGSSLPKFQQVLAVAARKHLLVQMGYMYRYSPAIVMLREFLRNGWLGEVFEVHAVMSKVVPASRRAQLAEYPGGIMFELGCHIIDLVVGILGPPAGVKSFRQHASAIDDELVDNMLGVFTYPRALATVKSSAMEVEGFARRHLAVCGAEGTFHVQPLDAPAVRFALTKPRGKYKKGYQNIDFGRYQRYVADAADMAKIVRGEKDTDFPYDHDLAVQKTVLQASGLIA